MFDEHESEEFELNSPPRSGEGQGEGLTPELVGFCRKLANFTPAPPSIDRDQLMYNAGRASAIASSKTLHSAASRVVPDPERTTLQFRHFWPAATVLLSAMLLFDRASEHTADSPIAPQVETVVESTTIPSESTANELRSHQATRGYLGIRNVALTRGIGAAAIDTGSASAPDLSPAKPATTRQLFHELVPESTQQRS